MSLESKAKTSKEIFQLWNDNVDKTKWVPIEEAQKLETEIAYLKADRNAVEKLSDMRGNQLEQAKEAISLEHKRFEAAINLGAKLEAKILEAKKEITEHQKAFGLIWEADCKQTEKIAEANKILDEIAQGSHTLDRVILVKRLHEVLK
jgi:hypothetical protein